MKRFTHRRRDRNKPSSDEAARKNSNKSSSPRNSFSLSDNSDAPSSFRLEHQRQDSSSREFNYSSSSIDFDHLGDSRAIKPASGSFTRGPRTDNNRLSLCLSVSQLRFDKAGLFGRDEEMEVLEQVLNRIQESHMGALDLSEEADDAKGNPQGRSELVLLSGHGGTGKSALISKFAEKALERKAGNVMYAYGKFDSSEFGATSPFDAYDRAFTDLAEQVMIKLEESPTAENDTDAENAIKSAITELSVVLPGLRSAIPVDDTISVSSNRLNSERERQRFYYLVRHFLRVVSSYTKNLIILALDDLQWADQSSLTLFVNLASYRELSGMLLCGCYRDEEVDKDHPLSKSIEDIKNYGVFSITDIKVLNLSLEVVNSLISELLGVVEAKTMALASVVYEKTEGNAFFVKQFIYALKERGLLTYNVGGMKWMYETEAIRSEMTVSDNVRDFMMSVLQNELSPEAQRTLQLAACLGSTFDEQLVELGAKGDKLVTDKGHSNNEIPEGVRSSLLTCVKKGLLLILEQDKARTYRFTHDHIQRAAFELIPEEERKLVSLGIGESLVANLCEEMLDEYVFVAADLWNRGVDLIPLDSKKRVKLAELNLMAGTKAVNMSAAAPGMVYLQAGVDAVMGSDMAATYWQDNKDLMVGLFSTLADAAFSCADRETTDMCIDVLLAQDHLTLTDQLLAYSTKVRSLGAQNKLDEAIESSLVLLRKMGVKLPNRNKKLAILCSLLKTKQLLARYTSNSLLNLPKLDDFSKKTAMRVMDNLLTYAYAVNQDLMVLTTFKMVRWSVKYGLCAHSAPVFAVYGLLTTAMGDSKKGAEYANLALSMVRQLGFPEAETRVVFIAHHFVLHWVDPIAANLKAYRHGYKVGLRTGDIENAMLCIMHHCDEAANIGRSLPKVVSDLETYSQQAKDFDLDYFYTHFLPHRQFAMNMMGDADNPVVLTGKAMNQEDLFATKQPLLVCNTRLVIMWLAVYFGEYELAWEMAESSRDAKDVMIGTYQIWRSAFFEGLALFSLARRTREKVWTKRAHRVVKQIKTWEKRGNVNCRHIVSVFEAEQTALEGKVHEARNAYGQAISKATKLGFLNDRALFNERAGAYLLDVGDDDSMYWAKHYLQEAYQLYAEWEAWGKTAHLRKLYPSMFANEAG